jgi:NAD(P)-dependent dehydrogenase (short-subunit alcohol dehydrogenase family)
MIDYSGKVALVTGGASGIGKAIAEALRARGASVVTADVQNGADIVCDLADAAAPEALVARIYEAHGRLDLLCSNAGIGHNRRVIKEPLNHERLFAVNTFAAVRLAQAYVARLKDSGARGRLMITGSENSLSVPSAVKGNGLGLYAASKHAVLILAEWLRDECASGSMPLDIHVLLPGAVYTPLVSVNLPDPAMAPKALGLIMPERCAEIALDGLDKGLFYIPTHAHLIDDMGVRYNAIAEATKALGLKA